MLLSVDEQVQVHEQLPELLGMARGEGVTHEWLVPGTLIAGLGVAVLVYVTKVLEQPVRRGLLTALLVFATGAVIVEGLSGLAIRRLPVEHPIRVALPLWEALEESFELVGCIVAIGVILGHLQHVGVLVVRRAADLDRAGKH